jgi:hypothetical protein
VYWCYAPDAPWDRIFKHALPTALYVNLIRCLDRSADCNVYALDLVVVGAFGWCASGGVEHFNNGCTVYISDISQRLLWYSPAQVHCIVHNDPCAACALFSVG